MSRPSDIELMAYADGELDEAELRAFAERLAGDGEAQAKLAALEEVGETVRTYVELAGDRAEPRFDAMWSAIEQRLENQARASASATAPTPVRAEAPPVPARGLWAAFADWLDGHRGHIITGAVSAGAVAALILVLRPPREVVRERVVAMPTLPTPAPPAAPLDVMPAHLPSVPPEIVELDVVNGSGTVFTLPDEDGDGSAAVIWVTFDEMEGPI